MTSGTQPDAIYDRGMYLRDRFMAAVKTHVEVYSDAKRDLLQSTLMDIIGSWNPAMMCSDASEQQLVDTITKDENLILDWLMRVKFTFLSITSTINGSIDPKSVVKEVIDMVAASVSYDMDFTDAEVTDLVGEMPMEGDTPAELTSLAIISKQYIEDLPTSSQVRATLLANPWLIIIMLIQAYIDLDNDIFMVSTNK
jgi:hypothetical protein